MFLILLNWEKGEILCIVFFFHEINISYKNTLENEIESHLLLFKWKTCFFSRFIYLFCHFIFPLPLIFSHFIGVQQIVSSSIALLHILACDYSIWIEMKCIKITSHQIIIWKNMMNKFVDEGYNFWEFTSRQSNDSGNKILLNDYDRYSQSGWLASVSLCGE